MQIQTISTTNCFTPGADLWIAPDHPNSLFTKKLDWYLNFQLIKSSQKSSPKLSPTLCEILKSESLPEPQVNLEAYPPLLIPTSGRLPAQFVVFIPNQGDFKLWLSKALLAWKQLNQLPTRVFLPPGLSLEQCQLEWKQVDCENITLVLA